MPSCLGIYVEENLIKYAKVSKEHDNIKVESYGIKFYDNIETTLKQIVSETYSFKDPISINISDEKYHYSNLFNLLNKKYFEKAINTEFEMFCNESGKNRNSTEMRYIEAENIQDKDKDTILYVYCNKTSVATKSQIIGGYKAEGIYPLPIAITNLKKFENVQNSIIVNIEDKTSITLVVNGKIYRVSTIDLGMKEILDSINLNENSYQKSYEICKNSTIYTLENKNLQTEENDHMDEIMPTLYSICEKVRDFIQTEEIPIDNIYLTGLATAINNVDLYFQENFPDKTCQILSPYFANKSNLKINVRDYIEVNSAIALALQYLEGEIKGINFKKKDSLSITLTKKIGEKGDKAPKAKNNNFFKIDFDKPLDKIEKWLLRGAVGILILIVLYTITGKLLVNNTTKKQKEINEITADANQKISSITSSTDSVNKKANEYETLIKKIDEANQKITENYASKNAIPNFLTQLMFAMPYNVQIVSIENTSEKEIQIVAQAEKYEQLGYLKATLKNSGILTNITSTSGTKQSGVIEIRITGKLPY